jgi:uncharacterized protein
MQRQLRLVVGCAAQVPPLLRALIEGNVAKLGAQNDKLFDLENGADGLNIAPCDRLPRSPLMPVVRRDLREVLGMQDSVADTAQDIAGLLVERKIEVPPGWLSPGYLGCPPSPP